MDTAGFSRATGARTAAFFDLDKTVVAKSSTLAFGRELYREGLLSRSIILRGAYAQLAFTLLGANAARMERSRVAILDLTKGWEAERVKRLIRETLQEVIDPLIYAEALELFEEHRNAGRDLYFVSSSGVEVVEPLAEYLGVPHVLATIPGVDQEGFYDGTLDFYCYGPDKAVAIAGEAQRRGLDLAGSYAYSDSITDLPMLEAVGHPVAVNPDRDLRAVAKERGWEITDFTRPVSVRSRISQVPRPPAEVVASAAGLSAVALAGYVLYQRRTSQRPAPHRPSRTQVVARRVVARRPLAGAVARRRT